MKWTKPVELCGNLQMLQTWFQVRRTLSVQNARYECNMNQLKADEPWMLFTSCLPTVWWAAFCFSSAKVHEVPSAWLGWFQNSVQMIQHISGCIKPDHEKKCPEGNELHSLQPNKAQLEWVFPVPKL
jgi:hypothetical protein